LQQEIRWLLDEKYGGDKTLQAEKDIARLEKGEHLDYVIGWVDFLGCKIDLSQRPFIPRPETEYWVDKVVQELRRRGFRNRDPYPSLRERPRPNPTISKTPSSPLRILDVFAGSGCVGIAVLKHTSAVVDFAERDEKFLQQIKINAKLNGIEEKRYHIIESDIFSGVRGEYNFILANPPYVAEERKDQVQESVLDQEPASAVFARKGGLQYIRKFLEQAKSHLVPGGVIYLEFDSQQKEEIMRIAYKFGFSEAAPYKDQYGKWRYARIAL